MVNRRLLLLVVGGGAGLIAVGGVRVTGFASGESGGCGGDETEAEKATLGSQPAKPSKTKSLNCYFPDSHFCIQFTGDKWDELGAGDHCAANTLQVSGTCPASAVVASCALSGQRGYKTYYYAGAVGCDNLKKACESQGGAWGGAIDTTCTKDKDTICDPNPCANNGTCDVNSTSYSCTCPPDFSGANCELISYCYPNPCKNGGTCLEGLNGYKCSCPAGIVGQTCETDLEPCSPDPCGEGVCSVVAGTFKCTCNGEWTGTKCDKDPCIPNPCQHGGTCGYSSGKHSCTCPAGYSGPHCETINPCSPNPCVGGTCSVVAGSFKCDCWTNWTGTQCEKDPCTPNPCENGGTCSYDKGGSQFSTPGKVFCDCPSGYLGHYCHAIHPCIPNPCVEGVCKVKVHNQSSYYFECKCNGEWTGTKCDQDPCTPNPCTKGGTCSQSSGTHQCACPDGSTGSNCGGAPHLNVSSSVWGNGPKLYELAVIAGIKVVVRTVAPLNVDLYARMNLVPSLTQYDYKSTTSSGNEKLEVVPVSDGILRVLVFGVDATTFTLTTAGD